MTENSLFTGDTTTASYVDQLVGEGKPYKTVEDLAKAAVFKENHIKTIEGENASLRNENTALKQVKSVEAPKTDETVIQPTAVSTPEVDLDKKIRESLEQAQRENLAKANITEVENHMISVYGTKEKAAEVIQAKANELGVSPAFLQSMAAQSPNGFYKLVGLENKPAVSPAAPKSVVNSASTSSTAEPAHKTYKWFVKTYGNPMKWSESINNQVHSAVFELGEDAFYA